MMLSNVSKAVYFPFSMESLSFIDYFNKTYDDIKITGAIFPNAWEKGISANHLVELYSSINFENVLNNIDVLIVSDFEKVFTNKGLYTTLFKILSNAYTKGKELWLDVNFDEFGEKLLSDIINSQNIKIRRFNDPYIENNVKDNYSNYELCQPEVPIIYICEMVSGILNYSLILTIANQMRCNNITPLIISDNNVNKLIGQYCYQKVNIKDEYSSVYSFNNYVNHLHKKTNSDIIFIKSPDGIVKSRFTSEPEKYWGIKTHMNFLAISPSHIIIVIPRGVDPKMTNIISNYVKVCYGSEVTFIESKKRIDYYLSKPHNYTYIEEEYTPDVPLDRYVNTKDSIEKLTRRIINDYCNSNKIL